MAEAKIHFEFHRHLANCMDPELICYDVIFGRSIPEYSEGISGSADLVVFDKKEIPWVVIEAKRGDKKKNRNIDPYSPKVINQAGSYAFQIGSHFFATFNGSILILFNTFEESKPILERKSKAYKIKNLKEFAPSFLCDLVSLKKEKQKWDALDEVFINRVSFFHSSLKREFKSAIQETIKGKIYKKLFNQWLRSQGFKIKTTSKKALDLISTQSAYVFMNLLIFRRVLLSNKNYSTKIPNLHSDVLEADQLFKYFELLSKKIDFGAVFDIKDVFCKIKLTDEILELLNDFKEELETYNLSIFDNFTIGKIYESLMSIETRRKLGQYYTPPGIVEFIVRNTILEENSQILDPAVGSGGFLVESYRYLREKYQKPHEEVIKTIFGFDINQFALNLSSVNLAVKGLPLKTDNLNLELTDFFLVSPKNGRLYRKIIDVDGEKVEPFLSYPQKFDVCIANPPYIRQENIPSKERSRNHLTDFEKKLISNKSDIYIYFITLSTKLLRRNGRIGFIISDRWLTQEYGFGFQQFLLRNYKIETIVKFETQVFEDALINTCIIIGEKSNSADERNNNIVSFIRLKGKEAIKADLNLKLDQIIDNNIMRLVHITQGNLTCPDDKLKELINVDKKKGKILKQVEKVEYSKWIRYFYSYNIFYDIANHENSCYLFEVVSIESGLKTGANNFFYNKKEDVKDLGLEKYTKPLLKGTGQINSIIFNPNDTDWTVLDINNLVNQLEKIITKEEERKHEKNVKNFKKAKFEPKKDKDEELILAKRIRIKLKENHLSLAKYLQQGKDNEIHKIKSVKSRRLWFNLGKLKTPPILFPAEYWRNSYVIYNKNKILSDKRFYAMYPNFSNINFSKEENLLLLLGILNSDIIPLMRELTGRTASGQGMNRNECMIYETKAIRIPDPRKINKETGFNIIETLKLRIKKENEKKKLETEFPQLFLKEDIKQDEIDNFLTDDSKIQKVKIEYKDIQNSLKELKTELNKNVLSSLSLENQVEELMDSVEELLNFRIHGRGLNKSIPFTYTEEKIKPIIRGATIIREMTTKNTLNKFLK